MVDDPKKREDLDDTEFGIIQEWKIKELEAERDKFFQRVRQLENENTKYQEQVSQLRTEGTKYQEEIGRLGTEGTRYREEIGQLRSDSQGLRDKVRRFEKLARLVVPVLLVALVGAYWLGRGTARLAVSRNIILRLHGSNTIGAELAPALAEAFLKDKGAGNVKTVPGDQEDEVYVQGIMQGESSPRAIEIYAHGSTTAFEDLQNNVCDVGMASRKIKSDEVKQLAKLGNMTSRNAEHVLGLDGIAVIINATNPIKSLSKEQIAKLFWGDTTDWREVGGVSGHVTVYSRNDKSGTYDTFKSLVLADRPLAPSAKRLEDSRELSDLVSRDSNAIGFIGLPYIRDAKSIGISESGTMPLWPNHGTVATEDYLLSRRLYLYTSAIPCNCLTTDFVKFALSHKGQDVVEEKGFIGQTAEPVKSDSNLPIEGAPPEYVTATAGAERLPMDFRFSRGSSQLDNKALDDLDRVISFVRSPANSGKQILLIGFADSSGPEPVNMELSKDRADSVAAQFKARGVMALPVAFFGSKLPVASNSTLEGREKNRRVEIWLQK